MCGEGGGCLSSMMFGFHGMSNLLGLFGNNGAV